MNLQPINPPLPRVFILCSGCGVSTTSEKGYADLDAAPGTYYCPDCAGCMPGPNLP